MNWRPLLDIFDPKHGHVEFFQNLLDNLSVGYRIFYHHFLFNFWSRLITYKWNF